MTLAPCATMHSDGPIVAWTGSDVIRAHGTIAGGPAPVRASIEELLPDVLEGRIQPGRVFDRMADLDGVPEGYRQMSDREAIKVMIDSPDRRRRIRRGGAVTLVRKSTD